ncbi:MAG: hypothetical protein Q9159_005119 [Coniocarpon cinnabarinum]
MQDSMPPVINEHYRHVPSSGLLQAQSLVLQPHQGMPSEQGRNFLELHITATCAVAITHILHLKRLHAPEEYDFQVTEQNLSNLFRPIPENVQPESSLYLHPSQLPLTALICDVRLATHRMGLSPAYGPEQRASSLDLCTADAYLTVCAIRRGMPFLSSQTAEGADPSLAQWEEDVFASSPWFFGRHLWRCIVVLCVSLDFTGAITCARVCAVIGGSRDANAACGHSLLYFLDRLEGKAREVGASRQRLGGDEEMLMYASSDLQGDTLQGWTGAADEGTSGISFRSGIASPPPTSSPPPLQAPSHDVTERRQIWPRILDRLSRLNNAQQLRNPEAGGNSVRRPSRGPSSDRPVAHQPSLSSASRMSIASLTAATQPRGEG